MLVRATVETPGLCSTLPIRTASQTRLATTTKPKIRVSQIYYNNHLLVNIFVISWSSRPKFKVKQFITPSSDLLFQSQNALSSTSVGTATIPARAGQSRNSRNGRSVSTEESKEEMRWWRKSLPEGQSRELSRDQFISFCIIITFYLFVYLIYIIIAFYLFVYLIYIIIAFHLFVYCVLKEIQAFVFCYIFVFGLKMYLTLFLATCLLENILR